MYDYRKTPQTIQIFMQLQTRVCGADDEHQRADIQKNRK